MDVRTAPVVVAPGVNGSGPQHWQSLWIPAMTGAVRTAPRSWDAPDREDWLAALDRAGDAVGGRPALGREGWHVLVAFAAGLGAVVPPR